jgi:hypothetical protein
MRIVIEHDYDCPKGINGLRSYWEAREAFAAMPPEAKTTEADKIALAIAESELESKQRCTCGAE